MKVMKKKLALKKVEEKRENFWKKCGVDRDFCDDGQRPRCSTISSGCKRLFKLGWTRIWQGKTKPDRPDREDCTVGERVIF